ncbi:glycosyltransferase [Thalassoroseus pseudoceratinae]|uniref:glycosyltransferase n=1 Tax=Thalassoroseus pseudoceratinae TaxID=2713176 RepID=UPI00141EAEAA|nr:glycosyltransferase [Thalassoroseus pseudoceratinae]
MGPDRGFGLAHQCRDIACHLPIDRWLIPGDPMERSDGPCRQEWIDRDLSFSEAEAWLDGLDVVLFVERPDFPTVVPAARRMGVRVICVPNWEWLSPSAAWLADVDLMLCPTRHTAGMLTEWKHCYRFEWEIACVPWPIDTSRIRFRRRRICRQFVYVHGSGGARGVWCGDPETSVRRKGLEILRAAAELAPEIRLIIYATSHDAPRFPTNVELRPPPDDNQLLYCDGDVCVQPSHWEGLGLPLLECQAAGMPLVTTDVAPMNEHQPLGTIPAKTEAMQIGQNFWIPAARIDPSQLAAVLRSFSGRRITMASRRARRFVQREHSWKIRKAQIHQQIRRAIATPVDIE